MQFVWLLSILFAWVALVAGSCPEKFKLDSNKLCTAERPIHGECPEHSIYNVNYNKCVYVARN